MFLKNSRYFGLPTVIAHDRGGREIVAVKLRRLTAGNGEPVTILGHDQLDVMSDQRYGDATMYWRIGDANTELEAEELTRTTGRIIAVPRA